MKNLAICSLLLVCCACTDPYNFRNDNPFNNINQGQGQGQGQNQSSNPPEDPGPSFSNVSIENDETSEDNVDNTTFDGSISITFNGDDATVNGSVENVSIQKNGARVTVTNNGDKKVKYILSGESGDGCFKLYSGKKQAIVLDNLSLTNTSGAAINNQSKKRTFIVLEGTNYLKDGTINAQGDYPEQVVDEDMKAVLFSEGQLAFSGSGTLTVNATGKAGITSDDYVRFFPGSVISVTSSAGHGIRGKDAVIVSGGTINVTLETNATAKKCFTTDSLLYIGGGVVSLVNKASAGIIDSELTGAAGIKADKLFVIRGGELSVTASGKGCKCISGDQKGFFEGGKVNLKATGANYNSTSAKAIKFDGNLEFSGSQVIVSSSSHEAIESKGTIYISGGSICATSSDDAINSASTMTISDGVVYARSTGNDGLDANGDLVIKGGTVFAVGCGNPEVGIDANTEKGYRLYIQGGNVLAIGGIESNSSVNQAVISTSWSRNTTYSLCSSDSVLFSFKTPASGGSGLFISSPSLVKGTSYSLKSASSISGGEQYFDGIISTGGTATGGSSISVTALNYTSSGNIPGGGFGPGW